MYKSLQKPKKYDFFLFYVNESSINLTFLVQTRWI